MPEADCGEGGFDRVGRSQVSPVLRREIVEGEQLISILSQTLGRGRVLRVVLLKEVVERGDRSISRFRLPNFMQRTPGSWLYALRKLAEDVAGLATREAIQELKSLVDFQLKCARQM